MLFRSLAIIAVIPSLVLALPMDKHSLRKRCKARATPVVAPTTDAAQGVYPSPSGTDVVPTTSAPAPAPTSAPTQQSSQAPPASESPAPQSPASTSDQSTDAPASTSTKSSGDSKPTKSESQPKPSSTTKPSNNIPVASDIISSLLPKGQGKDLWSTAMGIIDGAMKLTMDSFKADSVMSRAPAIFTGDTLKVNFKAGSWTYKGPSPSGLGFYSQPMDLSNAKEVTLSYQIKFDSDFDFNKGGKLPGVYGGESDEGAKSCSGGRRDTSCHSARFMWRTDGMGEVYTYLPDPSFGSEFAGNKNLCTAVPNSECNSVYGASVGRGSFSFPKGDWITIAQRVRLNDVGQSNGELQLIVNGESKFTVKGLAYRNSDAHQFRGIQMQSFFGGSTSDWASPKDQSLEMKDFSLVVTEPF